MKPKATVSGPFGADRLAWVIRDRRVIVLLARRVLSSLRSRRTRIRTPAAASSPLRVTPHPSTLPTMRNNVSSEAIVTTLAPPHTLPGEERRDAEEAGRLFADHHERILGYCLRQLGSLSEAEDAVQTTFLYALRALQRGLVPQCASAWLHGIAHNVCRWQRRTLAR